MKKYRRTLSVKEWIDPRAVFKNHEELQDYYEHDKMIKHAFKTLSHNERLIVYCRLWKEYPIRRLIKILNISLKTYYMTIIAFRSYDCKVTIYAPEQI